MALFSRPSSSGLAELPVAHFVSPFLTYPSVRACASDRPGAAGGPSSEIESVSMTWTIGASGSASGELGGKDMFSARSVPGNRS